MATSVRVSMTGRHEWHVVGECQDLLVGFVGIRLEKSVGVMEHDTLSDSVLLRGMGNAVLKDDPIICTEGFKVMIGVLASSIGVQDLDVSSELI